MSYSNGGYSGGSTLLTSTAGASIGVRGADLTCWLIAADRGLTAIDRRELAHMGDRPLVVVINKIDLVARAVLLPLIDKINA